MTGFKSTPEDLATHSATVKRLGEQLSGAATTGRGVDLGGETYGIIGQAFAGDVKEQITQTADAIDELASGLSDFGDGVESAGQQYQRIEDEIEQLLKKFGGE
ncbi:Excreted virulence factor EspC, type VII ESX diderm [Amycolatopsis arida]|uniref:Excreted virulence factor EspC, type VII ESX diderm n=1 Tax=Amycolatopsis arida TaxID=587909 RepID=A0A1I5UUQ0_9PSEU|nr:type VII secretion target [Amycolatopsis arida]TDX91041.1 excreted virulence factor EspC (type VII ESX diderm) [Amycolatopsis arida]SFP98991.1 Excreted virulence factor EspC, type VII ESX diderm [Amycolatopsis arida]